MIPSPCGVAPSSASSTRCELCSCHLRLYNTKSRSYESKHVTEAALRRVHGNARAEIGRSSKENTYARPLEKSDESDIVSIWDSNAESIRRSRPKSRPSFRDFRPEQRTPENWDYVSDTDSRTTNRQWWSIFADDDAYENDTDDDEETAFSWLNFENKSVPIFLWMFPAAIAVLPWLLGSPMSMMMAFALLPIAQKFLGRMLPDIWGALLQNWSSSSSKSKKKRSRKSSSSSKERPISRSDVDDATWATRGQYLDRFGGDSRKEADLAYPSDEGQWGRPWENNRNNQDQSLKLGGWDELEEDRSIIRKIIQDKKKARLDTRPRRRETPLFFRLLIALFPFLRSWGGFL